MRYDFDHRHIPVHHDDVIAIIDLCHQLEAMGYHDVEFTVNDTDEQGLYEAIMYFGLVRPNQTVLMLTFITREFDLANLLNKVDDAFLAIIDACEQELRTHTELSCNNSTSSLFSFFKNKFPSKK
jgi:hypothetical protein